MTTTQKPTTITNGSFTEPSVSSGFESVYQGEKKIPGWKVTEGRVEVYSQKQSGAPEGLQALELQGQPGQPGAVSQTFSTTAGVEVTLTWIDAVDGRGGCGKGERQKYLVRVTSGDNVVEHGYEPKPSSGTEWLEKSITFRARAGTSTVEFLSRSEASPTHCGAMITKVAVEQPQSTT